MNASYEDCWEATENCIKLFDSLGFTIHHKKSLFKPTQCIEYLGFIINPKAMKITLTPSKISSIKNLCAETLQSQCLTIKKVATLLGKFSSSLPAVKYGRLHYRDIERDKVYWLRKAQGKYEAKIVLSSEAKEEIQWWMNNIESSYNDVFI